MEQSNSFGNVIKIKEDYFEDDTSDSESRDFSCNEKKPENIENGTSDNVQSGGFPGNVTKEDYFEDDTSDSESDDFSDPVEMTPAGEYFGFSRVIERVEENTFQGYFGNRALTAMKQENFDEDTSDDSQIDLPVIIMKQDHFEDDTSDDSESTDLSDNEEITLANEYFGRRSGNMRTGISISVTITLNRREKPIHSDKRVMHSHKKTSPHKLSDWHRKATKANSLKRHVTLRSMLEGMSLNEVEKPHKCAHCSYKADTPSNLKKHVIAIHKEGKAHRCRYCGYKTFIAVGLKQHIQNYHKHCLTSAYFGKKPLMPIQDGNQYQKCSRCHQKFAKTSGSNVDDQKLNGGERPYKCTNCSDKAGNLKISVMNNGKLVRPLKCTHCSFKSFTDLSLKSHVQRSHQCKYCKYIAATPGLMKKHVMDIHKGKASGSKITMTSMFKGLNLN